MRLLSFSNFNTVIVSVFFVVLIGQHHCNAQNLVLNPSFEDVNTGSLQCSWYTSQAQFNNAINFWTCPTGGSTDIFNTALATTCYCSPFSTNASSPGTQTPRTGNGYVNIVTYGNGGCTPWREYIQGQLSSALIPGETYEVEMWVTLADKMSVGTNNIGVKFSTAPYSQASNCPYYTTPDLNYTGPIITDKDNWVQIIFCYTPTVAGLDNFIIGNFYDDAATSTAPASGVTTGNTIRYFVEDVRVELVTGGGNAGSDGALTTCTGSPSNDLYSSLGGSPDINGSWSGPSSLGGGYLGTFDPSIHLPGVYTYSVGGSGLCSGASSSANVTVSFSNPSVNIPAIASVCEGDPISLNEDGGVANTWSWSSDGSATFSDPFSQSPTINGAVNGETFTVSITDGSGCTNSANYTVSLNPLPAVNATNSGPYCEGDPMSLSESGGAATSWLWATNGSASFSNSNDQNPIVTGAINGETFSVTVTDNNGCSNTAQTVFTINILPTVVANDNGPYCEGDQMSVSETGGAATSWSWVSDGSASFSNSNDQNPTITGAVNGETFTVTVTDGNGCSNSAQTIYTIYALPVVTNSYGGSTYCEGEMVEDILVDVMGTPDWTISYTLDGSVMSTTSSASPISLGNSPGVYIITDIADANCSNTASETQSITINPIPSAPITGPDTTYCLGDVYMDLTASGSGGILTWFEDPSLTITLGTGSNLVPIDLMGTTSYYVTETLNGCQGPSSVVSISMNDCSEPESVIIPTAITPNNDGINDDWEIYNLDEVYPKNSVRIYNRWGNILFQHDSNTDGPYNENRWDGTFDGDALPVGSYYYVIDPQDSINEVSTGAVSIIMTNK